MLRDRIRGDHLTPSRRQLENHVESGIMAGIVSAMATAAALALGGVLAGVGPWVPFYAVVAIVDPGALEAAQNEMSQGLAATFYQQQFTGGLGVCLVLGAVSGVVFALGIRGHRVEGWVRYLLGAVHGTLMMCFFYLGVLQTLGVLAGVEADAMSLSRVVGWPMLVAAHAVHGVVLAWVLGTRVASTKNVFADAIGSHKERG